MYREIYSEGIAPRAGAKEIIQLITEFDQHAKAGSLPSLADFGTGSLTVPKGDLVVVQPVGEDFLYRHYGSNVAAITGGDLTGRRLGQIPGEVAAFFGACCRRALAERRPLHVLHCTLEEADSCLWERLLLPARDEKGGEILVVFNRPHQVPFAGDLAATPPLAGALTGERLVDVPPFGIVHH